MLKKISFLYNTELTYIFGFYHGKSVSNNILFATIIFIPCLSIP